VAEHSSARRVAFLPEEWMDVIFVDDQNEGVLVERERDRMCCEALDNRSVQGWWHRRVADSNIVMRVEA